MNINLKIVYTSHVSDLVDSFSIDTFIKLGIIDLSTVCMLARSDQLMAGLARSLK